MSWKRQQFTRRARELVAEHSGKGRAYVRIDDIEEESPCSLHYIWNRLCKAWTAGRAMNKPLHTLSDEAVAWLSETGVKHSKEIGQAFFETKIEPRIRSCEREISRFDITKAGSTSAMSVVEEERRTLELHDWYTDLVTEFADLFSARSMPDANHGLMEWQERDGVLPKLLSLYRRGPRANEDRNSLVAVTIALTGASKQKVEIWIAEEERHSEDT